MINYLDYFPEKYKPNKQQIQILTEISKAKNAGYKYVVINAPTGTGKSLCAKTLANSLGDPPKNFVDFVESGAIYDDENDCSNYGCFILTVTKALQSQYGALFDDGIVLKGKSNYPCKFSDMLSCDIGECVFNDEIKICQDCPYYSQRNKAVSAKCSFLSYAMFTSLPANCRNKEILICDEASELEDVLVGQNSITFDFAILSKIDCLDIPVIPRKNSSYEKYIMWLKSFRNDVFEKCDLLRKSLFSKKLGKKHKKDIILFKTLTRLYDLCDKVLNNLRFTEYIIEHEKGTITFKPYSVAKIAQDIFSTSDFVVLMSATIIDPENFAKHLGINENEFYYIEAESTFDPKKAPIYLSDAIAVTYSNKAVTIPKLAILAKGICDKFSDKKGIIHTHTMDITKELKRTLGDSDRFLYREPGTTNEMIIDQHIESEKPTVLVSPSMTHGIDLKGELGEFAIVMKAPFLPLGDKRVKRLCEEDPAWYMNKMISNFIQMCGRTVRSKNDESQTFVLDATLTKKIVENKDKLPKYFLERLV